MNVFVPMIANPFAHRVGWVLFHSIWEGALVGVLFAAVRFGLRRRSADARYLAGCIALLLLILAPVITILRLPVDPMPELGAVPFNIQLPRPDSSPAVGSAHPLFIATPVPQCLRRGTELIDQFLPWMVPLWVFGVAALSCRWMHGSRWLRHIRANHVEPVDPEWISRLTELRARLNIVRPVQLLKSALIEVPLVVGWLRPVILLPASALSGLTPSQLEAILAHELAHVRRCDYLVNTFQNLVETLMFYHPAVWWVSRCIREERELCCDDMVLRICGDRLNYVRALVTLEKARGVPRLAFAASGGSLLHRVRRLLGASSEGCSPSAAELSGIALVAIGCVFVLVSIWLLNVPPVYEASTLIKVNPSSSVPIVEGSSPSLPGTYYPYFLQTECLVIRSPAVLELANRALETETNSHRVGSANNPPSSEALRLLRSRLKLLPVPSTSVIEIQANASEPAQTARTANAVAAAYKEHRFQQRRQSVSASLDALEARFADQSQKISHAQQLVDKLRVQLKIPDAVVSENMPTVLLSAETLRHIEALRIEAQAEHVKEKTLLENLRQLDPNDLPATILTVGIQDNQLASLSESLALVEQKLVSLQKELGPENTEYLKAAAQQEDLRRKIRTRTRGILMGLQAKVESTGEGLTALNDAVAHAQASDLEQANRSRPYFEAKRDLEELIRFRQILQTKIAMERTDIQLPEDRVEIVEEAVPPIQAIVPNRPRAFALLSMGLLLALTGWFLTRAGRPGIVVAKVS